MLDFVLGFINNKSGKRVGIRLYSLSNIRVYHVGIPKDGEYLNLTINGGRLVPKHCLISEFPVFTMLGDTLVDGFTSDVDANAWVLSKYDDGRLKLLSVTGQVKTVTNETALGFHNQYKIVGCVPSEDGSVLIPPNIGVDYAENTQVSYYDDYRKNLVQKYLV